MLLLVKQAYSHYKSTNSAPLRESRKGEERGMPNERTGERERDRWGSESEGTRRKKGRE